MRHRPFPVTAALLLMLGVAGCSDGAPAPLDAEAREACREYQRIVNDWGAAYGAELGAVGQASAAGDERRQETAVAVVRELYASSAAQLRAEATQLSHPELADALAEAADGLAEIAEQIETYDDVTAAPELMSAGRFAEAGERASALCAG